MRRERRGEVVPVQRGVVDDEDSRVPQQTDSVIWDNAQVILARE
nr:hypothetical protein [Mycolicibacterium smegmatis]